MKKQKTFFLSKETNFSEVLGSRRIFKKGHPNRIWGLLTINSPKYKITQNRFIPILLGKILTPCQTEQQTTTTTQLAIWASTSSLGTTGPSHPVPCGRNTVVPLALPIPLQMMDLGNVRQKEKKRLENR